MNVRELTASLLCGRIALCKRTYHAPKSDLAVVATLAANPGATVARIARLTCQSRATAKNSIGRLTAGGIVADGRVTTLPEWAATYPDPDDDTKAKLQYVRIPVLSPTATLTPTANRLLWLIVSFCRGKHGRCYASHKGLATMLGVGRATARRGLSDLVKIGIIIDNVGDIKPRVTEMIVQMEQWQSAVAGLSPDDVRRWRRWLRRLFKYAGMERMSGNFLISVIRRWPCRRVWQDEQCWAEYMGRTLITFVRGELDKGNNKLQEAVLRRLSAINKYDYTPSAFPMPTTITPIDALETMTPQWLDERERESEKRDEAELAAYQRMKQGKPKPAERPNPQPKTEPARHCDVASFEQPFREAFASKCDLNTVNCVWHLCQPPFRNGWLVNTHRQLNRLQSNYGRTVTADDIAAAQHPDVWALWDLIAAELKQ